MSVSHKKNIWYRHYNTAHEGKTMSELWAENDTETIAFYWVVLEMVSRWESPKSRGVLETNLATFRLKLGMKSQRSRKLLTKISQRFDLDLEWISPTSFKLLVRNWPELQQTNEEKVQKKSTQNKEYRDKSIEERSKSKNTSEGVADAHPPMQKKSSSQPTLGSKIWDAYSTAFFERYGTEPTRNVKTNSQAAALGKLLGEDAVHVVKFYLQHSDSFFVREHHSLGICLVKAESLHTQWKRGIAVTDKMARQSESTSHHKTQMQRLMEKHDNG